MYAIRSYYAQHADAEGALALVAGGSTGRGYLLKERVSDVDQLVDALRAVRRGESVIDPHVVDLASLREENALREQWHRYHLIGETLRSGLPDQLDLDLAARVRQQLEAEPAILVTKLTRITSSRK